MLVLPHIFAWDFLFCSAQFIAAPKKRKQTWILITVFRLKRRNRNCKCKCLVNTEHLKSSIKIQLQWKTLSLHQTTLQAAGRLQATTKCFINLLNILNTDSDTEHFMKYDNILIIWIWQSESLSHVMNNSCANCHSVCDRIPSCYSSDFPSI